MLVGVPVAGIRGLGSPIVKTRTFEIAPRYSQLAALEFEPSIGAHLLGREPVLRFEKLRLGLIGVSHRRVPVSEPRQSIPRPVLFDQPLERSARLLVTSFLKIDVGKNYAAFA